MLQIGPNRSRSLQNAADGVYDICILGGGILGASVARDAALRGYRVLLLEMRDYAYGTSSRSSKLLHGGVRYLEQGDIGLVAEALAERSTFLAAAPHIVRAQRFLYPIIPGMTRPAWQVKLGLMTYDYLSRLLTIATPPKFTKPFRGHAELEIQSAENKRLKDLGLNFTSLLGYVDAQMEDSRLVVENILDAQTLGATTLNYLKVTKVQRLHGGQSLPPPRRKLRAPMWAIHARCHKTSEELVVQSRYIVNATGAWLSGTQKLCEPWKQNWAQPVYSRGTHLLFETDLKLPGLILPTGEANRYYFVIPYFSPFGGKTLVGTTDRAVSSNEENPRPDQSEIAELLGYLARDLPAAGLNEQSLYHAFCGMRVLASRPSHSANTVSQISRREEYLADDGYLAVLGGKYTTSRRTAEKVLIHIENYFGGHANRKSETRNRPLPGGVSWTEEHASELRIKLAAEIVTSKKARELIASHELTEAALAELAKERARVAVNRFGMRAEKLLGKSSDHLVEVEAPFLRSEVELSFAEEQACCLEDVFVRRLGIRFQPHGPADYQRWLNVLK